MRKYPIITIVHAIFFTIAIGIPSTAQDSLVAEFPKVRIGMNLGFHFDNPHIQQSNFNYTASPKIGSGDDFPFIHLFMANRISRRWYINTSLAFMNSATTVNATYTIEKLSQEVWLFGQQYQTILSFSWKIEYWIGSRWYINTGPAFNMVLHSWYKNWAPSSPGYNIDDLVSGKTSFWGWQGNVGWMVPISTFAFRANIGYLRGEQVDGAKGDKPNLIHQVISFSVGLVSEF